MTPTPSRSRPRVRSGFLVPPRVQPKRTPELTASERRKRITALRLPLDLGQEKDDRRAAATATGDLSSSGSDGALAPLPPSPEPDGRRSGAPPQGIPPWARSIRPPPPGPPLLGVRKPRPQPQLLRAVRARRRRPRLRGHVAGRDAAPGDRGPHGGAGHVAPGRRDAAGARRAPPHRAAPQRLARAPRRGAPRRRLVDRLRRPAPRRRDRRDGAGRGRVRVPLRGRPGAAPRHQAHRLLPEDGGQREAAGSHSVPPDYEER